LHFSLTNITKDSRKKAKLGEPERKVEAAPGKKNIGENVALPFVINLEVLSA
jgi:hypothetical protein